MKRQLLKMATILVKARRDHRSSERRLSVWRKAIALWLSLTLVVVPLLGGRTLTTPAQAQICGGANPNRIFQGCPLGDPAYESSLENQALDTLLDLHQLPHTDRSRLLGWERGELRALIYSKLLDAIKKAPNERTEPEKAALNALAALVKQKRVEAAQFAVDEYNRWRLNPCTYTPPTGFSYSGAALCAGARINPFAALDPPKYEEFQAYGVARAFAQFQDLSTQRMIEQVVYGVSFLGGVAGGGIAGAAVAANLSGNIIKALFPFGTAKFTGAAVGGGTSAVAAGTRFFAFGGPVLIVITAIVTGILRGIDVANIAAIPGKLQEKLNEMRSAPLPDLAQLITTENGQREVFTAFILMTLPDFPATDPVPAAQASDPKFKVQQDGAGAATIAETISFNTGKLEFHPLGPMFGLVFETQSARLNGGWFINKYREDNLDKERLTLSIDYLNWRGERWTAARAGAGFIHSKFDDPTQTFESAEIKYWDANEKKFTASLILPDLEIGVLPVVATRNYPNTLKVARVSSDSQAPHTLGISVNNGASATVTGVTISNLRIDHTGLVTADLAAACTASPATFMLRVTASGQSKTVPLVVRLSPIPYAFDETGNVLSGTLPDGVVGTAYQGVLNPVGGPFIQTCVGENRIDDSFSYAVTSGQLPPGLSFGQIGGDKKCTTDSDGAIRCVLTIGNSGLGGTPTSGGTYDFTVKITYGTGDSFTRDYTVKIASTPALLPTGALSWWSGERGVLDDLERNHGRAGNGFNQDSFALGKVGLAFSFKGDNTGPVQLPDNFFPFAPASNQPFTFETWFKTGSNGVIFGRQDTDPGGPRPSDYTPGIYVGWDGKLRVQMFWNGTKNPVTSQTAVNDNYFHHVAVIYDGTQQVVYLDGNEMGRAAYTQASSNATYKYQIGSGWSLGWPAGGVNPFWHNFTGLIDEPTLYGRALTEQEVQSIYAAGSAGKVDLDVNAFHPICAGTLTGVIQADVLGNNFPYSFALDLNTAIGNLPVRDFQSDGVFINLSAGSYTVKLKDNQGRISTQAVTLNDPAPLGATISGGGLIRPGQTAVVNVAVSGGTAPYTVTLSNNGGTKTGSSPLSFTLGPQTTTTYTIASVTSAGDCQPTVTRQGSATIAVDSVPPVIACPPAQSAVSNNGPVVVNYPAPTANDNLPGVRVACVPPAGASFPLGTTTVTCTATDAASNTATCSFAVTVRQPRTATKDLLTQIRALVPPLNRGQSNALMRHLEMASTRLEQGQSAPACTHLQSFVTQVNEFVTSGHLTQAQGQSLTGYANQIRNAVGCAGSPFPT